MILGRGGVLCTKFDFQIAKKDTIELLQLARLNDDDVVRCKGRRWRRNFARKTVAVFGNSPIADRWHNGNSDRNSPVLLDYPNWGSIAVVADEEADEEADEAVRWVVADGPVAVARSFVAQSFALGSFAVDVVGVH